MVLGQPAGPLGYWRALCRKYSRPTTTTVKTFRSTLTESDAMAGTQPPLMTRDDWRAMYDGSLVAMHNAHERTSHDTRRVLHKHVFRFNVRCTVCIGGTVPIQLMSHDGYITADRCINCNTSQWMPEDLDYFEAQLNHNTLDLYSCSQADEEY